MSITVLRKVEKDPDAFIRQLRRFYRFELCWTKTFKRWERIGLGHRVKHLKNQSKFFPGEINTIANIIRCMDKLYPPEGKIGYGNKTATEIAIIIYQTYGVKINKYMTKRYKIGTEKQEIKHTGEEAFEELKARGFILKEDVDLDSKLPYVYAMQHKEYVYPAQFELYKSYEVFPLIGVSGYTSLKPPRSFK